MFNPVPKIAARDTDRAYRGIEDADEVVRAERAAASAAQDAGAARTKLFGEPKGLVVDAAVRRSITAAVTAFAGALDSAKAN